jgi:hypothetical protein
VLASSTEERFSSVDERFDSFTNSVDKRFDRLGNRVGDLEKDQRKTKSATSAY